jgi:hypothetical protein
VPKVARRGAPAVVAAVAALLAPGVAAGQDSSRYDDTVITITYTGTMKSVRNNPITQPLVTQVVWDLAWTGTVYNLEHVPQYFTVRKLTGATAATVPNHPELSCSATIAQRAGVGIGVSGGRARAGTLLTVRGNAPTSGEQLQNDDVSPGRLCDTYPGMHGGAPNMSPRVSLRLGRGLSSVSREFDAGFDGEVGPGSEADKLTSTLALQIGTVAGGGAPPGARSTPEAVRRVAKGAIVWDLPAAAYSCFVAGTGVDVLATGDPALGAVVGPTMSAVAGPVCARLIRAIKRFARTYDDPPLAHWHRIARVRRSLPPKLKLPRCARVAAQARSVCVRLTRAARGYVAAVRRVTDVASTLAITVGRESAAQRAGDTAARRRQARRAFGLVGPLRAVARAQAQAGARLAAALRAAGASGQLTVEQDAAANEMVLGRLTAAGVLRADITSAAGAALTPGPMDILSTLARGLS